ncbi:MAG TPA: esterase-like activity of phytase family protein [Propionibacteriaceae bacterium]|nr:esterase-like activity of phytase family protein [Propionibacteriaceae bacterium]
MRILTACLTAAAVGATLLPGLPAAAAPAAPAAAPTPASLTRIHPVRAGVTTPVLLKRATLSADFQAEGPPSGALATPANGRQGPFPGQVIPGFSAVISNRDGTFWAMPDNGFGAKTNSADFLLRLYLVKPDWETAGGGAGKIEILRYISLHDPDRHISFNLVNGATAERLLTGADLDIESVVRAKDGSFWIGDEFGPFLIHVSPTGRVLSSPVGLPGVKSPQNPTLAAGEAPTLPQSRGFEALAAARNGRHLYAIVEGALVNEPDKRRREIHEFDVRRNRYTGRTWAYQTDEARNVVGDAYLVAAGQLLVVERDDFEGAEAVTKRVYRVNLRRRDAEGFVTKRLVVDLLKIANPSGIGMAASPGAYGVDRAFSFPFQSVETVVPLGDNKLLIANDNNYPGNDGRYRGRPDDTEMIVIDLRKLTASEARATVIAHRGASSYRPEHTLAAYALAIRQCADYIEPDVVSTKDGVLVARHENEISGTTDVSTRTEFASRRTTKVIDAIPTTGWFTEDFTLAELKTLRAVERLPQLRPQNKAFDGLYEVPTLDEVADLARHSRTCAGRQVGIYPETKHPTYFSSIDLPMEHRLLSVLRSDGFGRRSDPVVIQSFETSNLKWLNRRTNIRLAQLVNCTGAPYDLVAAGDPRTYADLVTRAGLRRMSRYADSLGACKDVLIPRDSAGRLLAPTEVIDDAHRAGMSVVAWTFRRENTFLPLQFRRGTDPAAPGDLYGEIAVFLTAGIDGLFSDNPDIAAQAARGEGEVLA